MNWNQIKDKSWYFSSSELEVSLLGKTLKVLPRGIAPKVNGKSV